MFIALLDEQEARLFMVKKLAGSRLLFSPVENSLSAIEANHIIINIHSIVP